MRDIALTKITKSGAIAILLLSGMVSHAQQVYRIVGPDGRVTFSDQPPPPSLETKSATGISPRAGLGGGGAELPYELRQTVGRYPVTIYTSTDCGPCAMGRSLLIGRGIPFSEKTVSTPEDVQALTGLTGNSTLPLLTIGSQQLKGYAESEWGQYLTAAGYPTSSQLPSGYRRPAATSMVTVQKIKPTNSVNGNAQASDATAAPDNRVPPPPPSVTADNPAGIKF